MSVCYIDCSPFMRALLTPDLAARLPGLRVHDEPKSETAVEMCIRDSQREPRLIAVSIRVAVGLREIDQVARQPRRQMAQAEGWGAPSGPASN